jgi:hypothetical protein
MNELLFNIIEWIKEDWRSNRVRCALEIAAWFMSIGCSITMMLTVPTPPFLILYPIFIAQCAIFAWAAKTRNSTGMVANYALLVTIDTIALIKMWLQ